MIRNKGQAAGRRQSPRRRRSTFGLFNLPKTAVAPPFDRRRLRPGAEVEAEAARQSGKCTKCGAVAHREMPGGAGRCDSCYQQERTK